jgi:hypothetical protein
MLCWHHHHAVHEGGWRLHGDPNGALHATSPDGATTLTSHPQGRRSTADPAVLAYESRWLVESRVREAPAARGSSGLAGFVESSVRSAPAPGLFGFVHAPACEAPACGSSTSLGAADPSLDEAVAVRLPVRGSAQLGSHGDRAAPVGVPPALELSEARGDLGSRVDASPSSVSAGWAEAVGSSVRGSPECATPSSLDAGNSPMDEAVAGRSLVRGSPERGSWATLGAGSARAYRGEPRGSPVWITAPCRRSESSGSPGP